MMKTNLNILYEDNHIIVVVKPENILSQADNTKDMDITGIIKSYLKEKYNKFGNIYLGLVHRLDRRVSGIMVFGKTSKASSRLSNEIRERKFEKTYYAIIQGRINSKGTLKNYIKKIKINLANKAIINKDEGKDFKEAILNYKRIKEVFLDGEIFSLIEVELITGRYNQIRAQFAYINQPIMNDFKYGYKLKNYNDQLGLVCSNISFVHPTTKENLSFSYFPKEGIWIKFL